jgi:hypothetical protein
MKAYYNIVIINFPEKENVCFCYCGTMVFRDKKTGGA